LPKRFGALGPIARVGAWRVGWWPLFRFSMWGQTGAFRSFHEGTHPRPNWKKNIIWLAKNVGHYTFHPWEFSIVFHWQTAKPLSRLGVFRTISNTKLHQGVSCLNDLNVDQSLSQSFGGLQNRSVYDFQRLEHWNIAGSKEAKQMTKNGRFVKVVSSKVIDGHHILNLKTKSCMLHDQLS